MINKEENSNNLSRNANNKVENRYSTIQNHSLFKEKKELATIIFRSTERTKNDNLDSQSSLMISLD